MSADELDVFDFDPLERSRSAKQRRFRCAWRGCMEPAEVLVYFGGRYRNKKPFLPYCASHGHEVGRFYVVDRVMHARAHATDDAARHTSPEIRNALRTRARAREGSAAHDMDGSAMEPQIDAMAPDRREDAA